MHEGETVSVVFFPSCSIKIQVLQSYPINCV